MSDNAIQSLTSTLATQALHLSDPTLQTTNSQELSPQQPQQNGEQQLAVMAPPATGVTLNLDGIPATPEQPTKRRPGRPKGSGKKPVDPNEPPKMKRPVGRPRKDGLPAGSVGPRRANRPRKRPPGTFASAGSVPPSPYPPYGVPFPPYGASISAPPIPAMARGPPPFAYPIDPNLDRDNWVELSRTRPDAFLPALVTALTAPNPLSASGTSVEEAFKSHLVSLAPNTKTASPAIPSLYAVLKTFWLPTSPPYFSLTASTSQARTPSEHRFFYWDPQPLVFNGIACPACAAPLQNRGRIASGPIKVYDLGQPFFIIGCEYVCKSPACAGAGPDGRRFSSADGSILRALPPKLQEEFPAHLLPGNPDFGCGADVWNWHAMGVSHQLWNMVRASLRVGLRKEAILEIVRAIQYGVPEEAYAEAPPPQMSQPQQQPQQNGVVAEDDDGDRDDEEEQIEGELDYQKDNSGDYPEPWNGNGVVEGQGQPPEGQPGPSQPQPESVSAMQSPPEAQPGPSTQYAQFPQPAPPYGMPPYAYPGFAYYGPPDAGASAGGMKRAFSVIDGAAELGEPLHKRVRHCCKCGSNECKGKGGRAFCQNPCQDCGKLDCKGRNSKRPDRTCADAWP